MKSAMYTHLKGGQHYVWTNYDYNSFLRVGNKYLAAGASGLFKIGGDKDDTTAIDAFVEPKNNDLGIPNPKTVAAMDFRFWAANKLQFTIWLDDDNPRDYEIKPKKSGIQRRRVPVGSRYRGTYVKARIGNVNGCDFTLFNVDIVPVILEEGLE